MNPLRTLAAIWYAIRCVWAGLLGHNAVGNLLAEQSAPEPEILDPLEEEFRALEDAVLKRDDPAGWLASKGLWECECGNKNALARVYCAMCARPNPREPQRYATRPMPAQWLFQNAYASAQMQYRNDEHDNLLRAMQAQQMQNMTHPGLAGLLGGAIGGALGSMGPKKPQ